MNGVAHRFAMAFGVIAIAIILSAVFGVSPAAAHAGHAEVAPRIIVTLDPVLDGAQFIAMQSIPGDECPSGDTCCHRARCAACGAILGAPGASISRLTFYALGFPLPPRDDNQGLSPPLDPRPPRIST